MLTTQPHQLALIEQAVLPLSARFDANASLLRLAGHEGFCAVQESLCYAVLLLARPSAGRIKRAGQLIDAVLETQRRIPLDPDFGAFPLTWSARGRRGLVVTDGSREIMGILLALLLRTHEPVLGARRSDQIREAVRRAIRGADAPSPEGTAGLMLAAWFDLEYGDRWRGQRLLERLRSLNTERFTESLRGDPRQMAMTLWAIGLWQNSSRLRDEAVALLSALIGEIASSVHPRLPEVFGAATRPSAVGESDYPWLGAWLTWHALGTAPLLPRALDEPLQACRFAFPALGGLILPADAAERFGAASLEGELERMLPQQVITGWSEPDLLIEARQGRSADTACARRGVAAPAGAPLVGVRWRTGQESAAWLRCRVSRNFAAHCRKRFVHLEDPGPITIEIGRLGRGDTRMVEGGWWLSGLHFSSEGLQMTDAVRTAEGLKLTLLPTESQPILMFVPLG